MTGRSCWRLLALCLPIFVAPTFLRGQNAAAAPAPKSAPAIERTLAPNLTPPRDSWPIAPAWIPPPGVPRPYPVAPQRPVFPELVRAAGIIFSGHVTSIGRVPSSNGQAPASTSVTFKVEHAMRGTSPGQSLTIHEWAGLWTSGERYRVGEHVLLFLYSPSKLGLTSPVAGAVGKFAMDSQGRITMNAQQAATVAADPLLSGRTAGRTTGRTGGKSVFLYADFAQAVQNLGGEK